MSRQRSTTGPASAPGDGQRDVVLFAAIGPNPASLSEAVWALYRERALRVVEAHLVSLARGHLYLHSEFLGKTGALSELHASLPGILDAKDVYETLVKGRDGQPLGADITPEDSAAYRKSIWTAVRRCMQRAGSRPVVFLLAGGRQRTTTAYPATTFQLLARSDDQLVDVRVSDRRVEGGTGFFFPEQSQRFLPIRQETVDARAVEVILVDVTVPRLRNLIRPEAFRSYEDALASAEAAIASAAPPQLRIDLHDGTFLVEKEELRIPTGPLLWFAALAIQRLGGTDEGWFPVADSSRIADLLRGAGRSRWVTTQRPLRSPRLAEVLGLHRGKPLPRVDFPGEQLARLRAQTGRVIREWIAQAPHRSGWERWLVPEQRKQAGASAQRLPLPADRITVRAPP